MPNGAPNNLTNSPNYKQEQRVIYLLEQLVASSGGGGGGSGSQYPLPYDYIFVTSTNGAGDPLVIEFYQGGAGGTLQFTHTLTYDGGGNFESLTITQ